MRFRLTSRQLGVLLVVALAFGVLATVVFAQDENLFGNRFKLSSRTFANNTILPISAIHNIPGNNNLNVCSIDGTPGGNQSPELSWSGAPPNTRTFVVTTYDVTANFTHWGMYNIPGYLQGLPENAGVSGSSFGAQIVNDFGASEYDGPCPPANVAPFVHHYVFTVYALDI